MTRLLIMLLVLAPVPKSRHEHAPPLPNKASTMEELVWWSSTGNRFIIAINSFDDPNSKNHCIVDIRIRRDLCHAFDEPGLADYRLIILLCAREALGGLKVNR